MVMASKAEQIRRSLAAAGVARPVVFFRSNFNNRAGPTGWCLRADGRPISLGQNFAEAIRFASAWPGGGSADADPR